MINSKHIALLAASDTVGRGERVNGVCDANDGNTLPCLYSNNSIMPSSNHYKTSFATQQNIKGFIDAKGLNNCAFVTLTFPDHVTDIREASRRFNSFRTNFLKKYTDDYIGVYELQQNGRVHFHFVVDLGFDIKTGFNFQQVKKRNYSSAHPKLRQLWREWRAFLPNYGFGRFEVVPIKGNAEAAAFYLAGYITKSLKNRRLEDKGFRIVRSSRKGSGSWKVCSSRFVFNTVKSRLWRIGLSNWFKNSREALQRRLLTDGIFRPLKFFNSKNYDYILREIFGVKWAYLNREEIMNFAIDINPPNSQLA